MPVKSELQYAKDVSINRLAIKLHTGETFDVSDMVLEFNIYESLFDNTMTGNIVILDAINIPSKAPLIGQEKLIIDFNTPSLDNQCQELEFAIYKISDREQTNDKSQMYMLHFMSVEGVTNAVTRISKSLKGTASEIARTICESPWGLSIKPSQVDDLSLPTTNPLVGKVIDIEDTKYPMQVVVPNWTPFKTLNWLASRSIAADSADANYLFYENREGYHFRSIGSLMAADQFTEQGYVDTYYYGVGNTRDEKDHRYRRIDVDFFRINEYQILDSMDTLAALTNGMFASRLNMYDLSTRQFFTFDYDYMEKFDTTRHLIEEDGKPTNKFLPTNENQFGYRYNAMYQAHSIYRDVNSNMYKTGFTVEDRSPEWLQMRRSQMEQLKMVTLRIRVAGDTRRKVGDIIRIRLPSSEAGNDPVPDPVLSGTYIVTGLRHFVRKTTHEMFLEIAKDGFFTPIPDTDSTLIP